MPELLANGQEPNQSWKYALTSQPIRLGRKTPESDWACGWDGRISRFHATLTWQDGKLRVVRAPDSRNPIWFRGLASDDFDVSPGEQFVIGGTTFTLQESASAVFTPDHTPLNELTCSRQELEAVPYTEAEERIKVLAALPAMIRYSSGDEQLEQQVIRALLQGIPRADVAAVVRLDPASPEDQPAIEVRAAMNRQGGPPPLTPSRRLLLDALRRRRQSVMHHWGSGINPDSGFKTVGAGNWALCAPLPDEPAPGYALYVSGKIMENRLVDGPDVGSTHKSDLKFAELVADIFGALRQVRDLQSRQGLLTQFFSPSVRLAFAEQDINAVLKPRQTDVTVLFCDLRGSCKIAEEAEHDLAATCERVGDALSIMTGNIIKMDGVVGDFQGDAAMGFWGWPFETPDQVDLACKAALGIYQEFQRESQRRGRPLEGFACGIGIAHGPAIAGRLGSADQLKVSVFGPVVNLAARLEGMTKYFKVPILVDDQITKHLREPRVSRRSRSRKLAVVQPYGMRKTLMVSELLPPAGEPGVMSDRDVRDYEAAVEAFRVGRWQDAKPLLSRLQHDGPSAVLLEYMQRLRDRPPPNWEGVLVLESK